MITDTTVVLRVSKLAAMNMGSLISARLQDEMTLAEKHEDWIPMDPMTRESYLSALHEIEHQTGEYWHGVPRD